MVNGQRCIRRLRPSCIRGSHRGCEADDIFNHCHSCGFSEVCAREIATPIQCHVIF
jgi:hypothetical protein